MTPCLKIRFRTVSFCLFLVTFFLSGNKKNMCIGWVLCYSEKTWGNFQSDAKFWLASKARFTIQHNQAISYLFIFPVCRIHATAAIIFYTQPGAIIGDGDRKRAPFLVLGLAPWYGTIFLFLEQIAPSPSAHARTCCEDFCGCHAGEWRPRFTKSFMLLAHNSTRLCLLEFGWSVFVVSYSSLSEVRQFRI